MSRRKALTPSTFLRVSDAPDPKPIAWLWPGRIEASPGSVFLLAGVPGGGKTSTALRLLASLTTGAPWPDGAPNAGGPRSAVLLAHEDDPGAIRARLADSGADPSRVFLWLRNKAGKRPRFPEDAAELEEHLRRTEAAALILDPVSAYVRTTGATDQIREKLGAVLDAARNSGAAVWLLAHPSKSSATSRASGLYFASGSAALPELARAAAVLGADPTDPTHPTRRVLAWAKTNNAALPGSLSAEIVAAEHGPRIEIGDPSSATADQVASAWANNDETKRSELNEARSFLRALLAGRILAASVVRREASAVGLSWATVRRAQVALAIRPRKEGATWSWSLPDGADIPPRG
jgi:putative DNA primase/helicase